MNTLISANEQEVPPEQTLECQVPDFRHWVNVPAYMTSMATVPLQTKRGCPHQCSYCTYSIAEGKNYRLAPPEMVGDAVSELRFQGFKDIEFVDNVFNSPYDHAASICEGLAEKKNGVRFHTVEINPRFLDDALLSLMERAGFAGIGISAESASDPVLAGLNKGYTAEDVFRAAQSVARHQIPCLWMFMLGGPGEDESTVRQTLNFAKKHIRPSDVAFFNLGIRIYPETQLEARARSEGILTVAREDMLSPLFYWSPELSLQWTMDQLRQAVISHPNFLGPVSISLPFMRQLHWMSYHAGLRPPLWRHTRRIRRLLRLFGKEVA